MDPVIGSIDGFRFGDRWISPSANEIGGVRIDAKAMSVLVALAGSAPNVVSTAKLLDDVWSDVVVGDNVVHQAIAHLRKALGDDSRAPHFIENIPRRGYRLIAPIASGRLPERAAHSGPNDPSASEAPSVATDHLDRIHVAVDTTTGDRPAECRELVVAIARYLSWQGGVFRSHELCSPGRDVRHTRIDYRVIVSVHSAMDGVEVEWEVVVDATRELVWASRTLEALERLKMKRERIAEMIAEGTVRTVSSHVLDGIAGEELGNLGYSRLLLKAEQLSYLGRERVAERAAALARAVQLEPKSGYAHASLANLLSWQIINNISKDPPTDASIVRAEGRAALFHGDNDPAVLLSVGTSFCRIGEHERGLPLIRRSFRMAPTVAAKDQLARSLCFAGQPDEAIDLFHEILETMPAGHTFPYVRIAVALTQSGRLEEALARAMEGVLHFPEDYYSWLVLANLLAQFNRDHEARQALHECRLLLPKLRLETAIEGTGATYGRTAEQRHWLTAGLRRLLVDEAGA